MLNENRFLGTFRGHNTRTNWMTFPLTIVNFNHFFRQPVPAILNPNPMQS